MDIEARIEKKKICKIRSETTILQFDRLDVCFTPLSEN
jgi:hypothetical protein